VPGAGEVERADNVPAVVTVGVYAYRRGRVVRQGMDEAHLGDRVGGQPSPVVAAHDDHRSGGDHLVEQQFEPGECRNVVLVPDQ
jgi:hypothetical protein